MGWLGKVIGGTVGFLIGGPIGAAGGAMLGHGFDEQSQRQRFNPQEEKQMVFFTATFSLLAQMADADGVIHPAEWRVIDHFMKDTLQLDYNARLAAENVFNQARYSSYTFEEYARQFHDYFKQQTEILRSLYELLYRIAMADGKLHPAEEWMLKRVREIFQLSDHRDFRGTDRGSANRREEYYKILGASVGTSDEEIKRKYRELVKKFHPDTIIAKGLPEEFVEFASQKFREIQEAYENIMKERQASRQ